MFKQFLQDSIIKEIKICRRLASKIHPEKANFRFKEDTRSIMELLHYLSFTGTGTISYWYRTDNSDFKTFFTALRAKAAMINTPAEFVVAMNEQVEMVDNTNYKSKIV